MPYTYRLSQDVLHDEEEKEYTAYGIEAVNSKKEILASFSDIFFDKQKAKAFVDLCNIYKLDIIHCQDAVEDAIIAQHTIFK